MAGLNVHLVYAAIIAIIIAILWTVAFFKKKQYMEIARGSIKAVIKRPTGWPLVKIVTPFPDGWVRVGKGDYKIAEQLKQEGKTREALTDEEHQKLGEYKAPPGVFEWDVFPPRPFLGLAVLQVPIRRLEWWENDPTPIMKPEFMPTWACACGKEYFSVTAVDAQAHSREMDAQNVAVQIQEAEARQKTMMNALAGLANKTIVYVGLAAAVLVGIIGLVQNWGG